MHNEDSTLFSLDELTKSTATDPSRSAKGGARAKGDEDSGLIDLDKLQRATSSERAFVAAAPPPLGTFAGPPPLGRPLEESTLNGLAAPELHPADSPRWRLPVFAALVLAGASAVALLLRAALPGEEPVAPAAQTIVVLAPAAPPALEADEVHSATPPEPAPSTTSDAHATPVKKPDTHSRSHAKPPTQRVTPEKPKTEAPKPAKPKDPCAHCGSDLACAMRCSVRGSG